MPFASLAGGAERLTQLKALCTVIETKSVEDCSWFSWGRQDGIFEITVCDLEMPIDRNRKSGQWLRSQFRFRVRRRALPVGTSLHDRSGCRLAERQALAGVENGWLSALASLQGHGLLGERQVESLRSLAQRTLLCAKPGNSCLDAIIALRAVGAPATCCDRLWAIAFKQARAPEDGEFAGYNWHYAPYAATEALGYAMPSPELDARIITELSVALDQRDFVYAQGLLRIGRLRQGPEELAAIAERALDLCASELALHSSDAPVKLASRCMEFLQARGALAPGRLLDWLDHPEGPLFTAALEQVKAGCDWAVPAVVAALESAASHGAVAARAAERLLCFEAISVQDARLDALLDIAPLSERAKLAATMLYFGADVGRLSRVVIEALCSSDEDLAEAGANALSGRSEEPSVWREALQRGVHASIRAYALKRAGMPSELELYWQDSSDEDSRAQDVG